MKLNFQEILNSKNKTIYSLSQEIGVSQNNLSKIIKGETSSIKYTILEKLCIALNCTPNDIFEIEKPNIITANETFGSSVYNPILSDEEIYEYETYEHETYEDEIEESRLEKEIKFETNLNSIMDFLLCDHNISLLSDKFKKEAERYTGMPMITSHKFIAFHRVLYLIAVKQLKNKQIVCFMIDLIKIYNQGGLTNLKDDELNSLISESDYILKTLGINLRD